MAKLFKVQVQSHASHAAELKITSIHPDSGDVIASAGFALMLLYEANEDNELAETIDFELLMNENWMSENARGFIESVEILDRKKTGTTIRIEATDPKWISHLEETKKWKSTAFSIAEAYEESLPYAPKIQAEGSDPYAKSRLLPIWKYFALELLHGKKEIYWVNIFNKKAYIVDKSIDPVEVSDSSLEANEGKFVKIGTDIGVLHKRKDDWGIFNIEGANTESTYANGDKIEFIKFDIKNRFTYKNFELSHFLSFSQCIVFNPVVSDNTIELQVLHIHREQVVLIPTKAHALQLLMRPFHEQFNRGRFRKGFPLPDFANAYLDKKGKEMYDWTMYLDVVDGQKVPTELVNDIIVDFSLEVNSNGVSFPDVKDLSPSELLNIYSFEKWPQSKIKITVSNPDFLKGFEKSLIIPFVFNYL